MTARSIPLLAATLLMVACSDSSPAATSSAVEVGTKEGYDTVQWSPDAALIWTGDLKVDNTILWRFATSG